MPTYSYNVEMTCEGCSNAVKRALEKIDAGCDINIDLEEKTVTVTTDQSEEEVSKALTKTGKAFSPLK